jgi:hypothetical protein
MHRPFPRLHEEVQLERPDQVADHDGQQPVLGVLASLAQQQLRARC